MKPNRETRFFRSKIEVRELTKEQRAEGYIGVVEGFIAYGADSRELRTATGKKFTERLSQGVFKRSLEDTIAVFADVGHRDAAVFAKRGVNLEVTEDKTGLRWVSLVPDTSTGRDLMTNTKLGIIDGTSFEFEVRSEGGKRVGEEWTKDGERDIRTLKDAVLHRVNPVTEPAYVETSLAARNHSRFEKLCAAKPEIRSYVPEADELQWMDPTLTPDCAFACEMMGHEMEELDSALEYLRASPSGAHAEYATTTVADAATELAMLIAWLAANGTTVNPEYVARAKKKEGEARTAIEARKTAAKPALEKKAETPPENISPNTDHDRERRLRILRLASA